MIDIKVDMNNKEVSKHFFQLKGAHTKATVRALNRIASSSKTAASNDIRSRVNIKKKDLDKHIKINKANYKNKAAMLRTTSKSKGIALFKFGGGKGSKRRGPSFMMKKGTRLYVKGGFIASVKAGSSGVHTNIFTRKGKERLPISQRFGPSAAKLMRARHVNKIIEKHVNKKWNQQYERDLKFYMRKK